MKAIKKLKEHKIFGEDSIVESFIEKQLWGTPFFKKALLRVKIVKRAATTSSSITPKAPLVFLSIKLIGKGFRISKNLNTKKLERI